MPNLDGYDDWDTYASPITSSLSDMEFAEHELSDLRGDLYPEDDEVDS